MAGMYEDEPGGPHPYCTCEIVERKSVEPHGVEVHWEPGETEVLMDRDPWKIRQIFHVIVYCCGQTEDVFEDHVEILTDWDGDPDEPAGEAEAEIAAKVEELIAECPDPECESLLVS
jgi:hypothetical protein